MSKARAIQVIRVAVARSRRLRPGLAVVVLAFGLLLIPAAPASAATGGGCGSTVDVDGLGYWQACISAPAPGVARPDGYITFDNGYPPCHIELSIWDSDTNARAHGPIYYACGTGTIWTYVASQKSGLNGTYRAGLELFYSGTSRQAYSPTLTLP